MPDKRLIIEYITTPARLVAHSLWSRYCNLTNTNPWAINDGLIDPDEHLTLTSEEYNTLMNNE